MKIAIVSPILVSVPPLLGGGVENIVYELAQGLAKRGHDITVFCAGGSTISGKNINRVECTPYPTLEHIEETRGWELKLFNLVFDREKEFDIIHFNYEPIIFRQKIGKNGEYNILDKFSTLLAFTIHNDTSIAHTIKYYQKTPSLYRHQLIFVSENQQSFLPFFKKSVVIYNGIPVNKFPMERAKGAYMFFLGRVNKAKGILEAIKVSKKTNIPLIIAAGMGIWDREFYESEVEPRIDGELITYLGSVDFSKKVEYLKKASCLLFPILWEEPFGLVMIEALACGTPVIAFRRGSVPEIIQDGVNGFVVDSVDEMAEAVGKVATISPARCRESVEKRFSVERMIDEYEDLFNKIASK